MENAIISLSLSMCAYYYWYALLLTITLATSFISYLIIKTLNKHHINEKPTKPKLPPGPKPWPIVGNLPEMLLNKPAFRYLHQILSDMDTEIACIRLGNIHVVAVTCPTIACEILRKQDANFASRPHIMSAEMISSGYLTAIFAPFNQQWKKIKKMVSNELISPIRLQWLHDMSIEEADNLVSYVYKQCVDGVNVNVRVATQQYCGNVIRRMIFNKRYFGEGGKNGGPGFEEEEHVQAIFTLIRHVYAFCVSDYMPCLRGFDLDGHEKKLKEALGILRKYHDPIVEERINQWKHGNKQEMEDWLDVLITLKDDNNRELLTPEEIKAIIIEVMIATVDNPSNAAEWAIAEMINQPELLERATQELDSVIGRDKLVEESDLCKLNYVKACAREAFRLHPMSSFIPPHVCMGDTIVANYFIPKGSHVIVSRRGLGRNPKVWDDPFTFKPERHFEGSNNNDHVVLSLTEPDLKFVSFSIGRRGCPGVTLGTSMTLMLLARLLHSFNWSVPSNVTRFDLSESMDDISLAKPLMARAEPRLVAHMYQTTR